MVSFWIMKYFLFVFGGCIKRSQFELDFVEKEKSKFFVEIDLKKSDAGFPLATSAMLGKSVLYAEKYPIMKFTSNSVKEVDNGFIINGTLNLRGISNGISMKVKPNEIYKGKEKYLTFNLETRIDRFNYGADGYSLLVDKTIFLNSEIILEASE
jgi:polyisoprenoid-binding protein YceI